MLPLSRTGQEWVAHRRHVLVAVDAQDVAPVHRSLQRFVSERSTTFPFPILVCLLTASSVERAQIDKRPNASGHTRTNSDMETYSYIYRACHILVDGLDELISSNILYSIKFSRLESSICWPFAHRSLDTCVSTHLIDQYGCTTRSAVQLVRVEEPNLGSGKLTWMVSVNQLSYTKTKDRELPFRFLHLTAEGHEHYRVGILLLEAAMGNTEKIRDPTGSKTAVAPIYTSADRPTHVPAARQSESLDPGSEIGTCTSAPSNCPTDSSQYDQATSSETVHPELQPRSQENVLERRMDEILADWEKCQADESSNSDSDDGFDIDAGTPSTSHSSDDSQVGYSGETCFARHGDTPSPVATESSVMSGRGSGNDMRTSGNDLLGRSSRPSQPTENGDSMDFGESLIADDDKNRKEKDAKVIPCPTKDCTGKERSISELL